MSTRRRLRLVVLVVLAPILCGSCGSGRLAARAIGVGTILPAELRDRIEGGGPTLLVDVREPRAFAQGHVPGALSLSIDDLAGYLGRADVPRDRPVVVVCSTGHSSLEAAAVAAGQGMIQVFNLEGGMAAWRASGAPVERGEGEPVPAELRAPLRLAPALLEQSLVTLSAFVVKPAYVLMALLLVALLWRSRDRDLALVRWGLAAFAVGELFCAVNFASAGGRSDRLELVHGLGMVVMGGLLSWGLFLMVDRRVLGLSDPKARCAAQRLCGRCWKRERVSCPAHRLFLLLAPALAFLALAPLSEPLRPRRVVLSVFLSETTWGRTFGQLLLEQRLYPLLGALLLAVAAAILLAGERAVPRSEPAFFLGFGLFSFSTLRFLLGHAFPSMPAWADVWEEATEAVTIFSIAIVLWVLRRQLGLRRALGAQPEGGGR